MNVIYPVESGAVVYYQSTAICGVSFVEDSSLAHCHKMCIPLEIAAQFVDGTLDHRQWFVWHNAGGVALYNSRAHAALSVDLIEPNFTRLTVGHGPISLKVKLYRAARRMVLFVDSFAEFHCERTALLPFVITEKNDPSAVLHLLDVPMQELLHERVLDYPLPVAPEIPIDVLTRRLFETYVEFPSDDADLLVPLPRGHFVDLMPFDRGPIQRGLSAVLRRADGVLRLALVGMAVERYSRPTPALRLLFSQSGDPSLLLHTAMVPLAELRDGVELELPAILRNGFDIWTPLIYRRASLEIV